MVGQALDHDALAPLGQLLRLSYEPLVQRNGKKRGLQHSTRNISIEGLCLELALGECARYNHHN